MKKLLMILLVISVFVLSGCTSGGDSSGGAPSISISNFAPVVVGASAEQPIRSGKTATLRATFANDGGKETSGSVIKLLGLPQDWTPGANNAASFELKPGQQKTKTWTVTAPVTSGYKFDISYPIEVRYNFKYGTHMKALFSWISDTTFDSLLNSGDQDLIDETLKSKGVTLQESSIGPISINIESVEILGNPEILLKIENNGNGHLGNNDLMVTSIVNLNCPELTGTSNKVNLIDNKYQAYCTVTNTGNDENPVNIDVSIEYDYYVKSTSTLYYQDRGM